MGAMSVIRLNERIQNPNIETIRISVMPKIIEHDSVLDLNDFGKLR